MMESLPPLSVAPQETQGFEVRAVRVQVEGLCPDCRGQRAPA